jgi:hypothetical protein
VFTSPRRDRRCLGNFFVELRVKRQPCNPFQPSNSHPLKPDSLYKKPDYSNAIYEVKFRNTGSDEELPSASHRPRDFGMRPNSAGDHHSWRFVTNHAHVLEAIATDPTIRLRDIAAELAITERTVAQIVNDLEKAGYLTKTRDGRRNRYEVHEKLPLRHPRHQHRTVAELIRFLEEGPDDPASRRNRTRG